MSRQYDSRLRAWRCVAIGLTVGVLLGIFGNTEQSTAADLPGRLVYNSSTGKIDLEPPTGGRIVGIELCTNPATGPKISWEQFSAYTPWEDGAVDAHPGCLVSSDLTLQGTTTPFTIGPLYPPGMDLAQLSSLLAVHRYSPGPGAPAENFDLMVVPEPGAGILGAVIAACAAASVRRRAHCSGRE